MKNVDYVVLDALENVDVLPNGFLSMLANLTRTGIFRYQKVEPDGTVHIIKQLRIPEEVFAEETMSSLSGIPITNNHPTELVSPTNASDYVVGMASDNPKRVYAPIQGDSEEYVQQRLTVFDEDVIKAISTKKKTQMSLGYTCELDMTPGVYKGEAYDCIQRCIRVNHASIVDKARGGEGCKVLLDGAEVILDGLSGDEIVNKKGEEPNVKKFTFNGTEYQVEDSVHALLTGFVVKLDEATVLTDSTKKDLEKSTAVCDDLKAQIKTQKDSAVEGFGKAVKARVELEGNSAKVLGSDVTLDGLSDREVKEKVIGKLRPEVELKDMTDEYITARYEVCLEDHASKGENALGKGIVNTDSKGDEDVAEKSRKAQWDHDSKLWEGDKK